MILNLAKVQAPPHQRDHPHLPPVLHRDRLGADRGSARKPGSWLAAWLKRRFDKDIGKGNSNGKDSGNGKDNGNGKHK